MNYIGGEEVLAATFIFFFFNLVEPVVLKGLTCGPSFHWVDNKKF